MEVKEDKVDQFLELKSAGFIYNELLREVDSNIFYLIEDWESEVADKAITLTVKTMKGVTFNE